MPDVSSQPKNRNSSTGVPDHHITIEREGYFGMNALCGARLVGIEPRPGSKLCLKCREIARSKNIQIDYNA